MNEHEAVLMIVAAIRDPGPRPDVHRQIMDRVRVEWPTLWAALDALMESQVDRGNL